MSKKIKITESQLKRLVENKDKEVNELSSFHINDDGNFEKGYGPAPDPYDMAQGVAKNMVLHPEFYKNEDLYFAFVNALYDVLVEKGENGEMFSGKKKHPLSIKKAQMNELDKEEEMEKHAIGHGISESNEKKEKIMSEFKRFL